MKITSEREFNYSFEKLNKAVEKCDKDAMKWVMASIRSNEKALCNREITDSQYLDNQQKVAGMVASFSYHCNCKPIEPPAKML